MASPSNRPRDSPNACAFPLASGDSNVFLIWSTMNRSNQSLMNPSSPGKRRFMLSPLSVVSDDRLIYAAPNIDMGKGVVNPDEGKAQCFCESGHLLRRVGGHHNISGLAWHVLSPRGA